MLAENPVMLGYSVWVRLPSASHLMVFLTFSVPKLFSSTKLEPLLLSTLVVFCWFFRLVWYNQVVFASDGKYGWSQAAQALEPIARVAIINKIGLMPLR